MLHYNVKTFKENISTKDYTDYVLGADIGGTHTNISVAGVKKSMPEVLYSLLFNTSELDSIMPAINQTLKYGKENYDINVKYGCFAAAGIVSHNQDFASLTNSLLKIDTNLILKETDLEDSFVINDFQAIGYGLNVINEENSKDILTIKGKNRKDDYQNKTKALIGAGTGLGKCILVYDDNKNFYRPLPSEGGHSDIPVYDHLGMKLLTYIKNRHNRSKPVNYEDLLSGQGLENIYFFIQNSEKIKPTKYTKEIASSKDKPALISEYRNVDETCKKTFELFTLFYARCAKNFVLDALSVGGLYIGGGIASKNTDIFNSKKFLNEFINADKRDDFLKKVPIYIIKNYDISLHGSCFAAISKYLR